MRLTVERFEEPLVDVCYRGASSSGFPSKSRSPPEPPLSKARSAYG
jgi:hypothetical protein